MHFLDTIEGRSGEKLAPAVLKFLLVNSSTMREQFVERLRPKLGASRAPTFRDGIICQCEYPTESDEGRGSIDLLIREESRMVFGVENKFWADFTDGQPRKYRSTLKGFVQDDESRCLIVVICPRARINDVVKHVSTQSIEELTTIVLWEDVLDDLTKLSCERPEVAAAASFLHHYVKRQLESDIPLDPSYVVGSQVRIGNDFHYDFLSKMKGCFPNTERICPAKSWIGFHFRFTDDSTPDQTLASLKQWFGFYGNGGNVTMGIHATVPNLRLPGLQCFPSPWSNGTFIQIGYEKRTTREWSHRLSPVLDELKIAVERAGPQ